LLSWLSTEIAAPHQRVHRGRRRQHVVIVLIWAAAMAYSIREYLADRRDIRVDTAAGPDASPVVNDLATRLR
jgi:hypothetical protein